MLLDEGWRSFFRSLCEKLGIKLGRDIWRFRYPPLEASAPLPDTSLTGNRVRWEREQPIFVADRVAPGSYSYSTPPDLIPDVAEGDIPFTEGNLTDRKDAAAPDADPAVEPYVVAWQTTEPLQITFDLTEPREVSMVTTFFSGYLPETTLSLSADGQNWTDGGTVEALEAGEDILSFALHLPGGAFRYVRLDLAERPADMTLTLCEVEIWRRN